jgi:hypothetical protein
MPDLHPVTGGRFEATRGKCLRTSLRVAAVDSAHAWEGLQRIARTPRKSEAAEILSANHGG